MGVDIPGQPVLHFLLDLTVEGRFQHGGDKNYRTHVLVSLKYGLDAVVLAACEGCCDVEGKRMPCRYFLLQLEEEVERICQTASVPVVTGEGLDNLLPFSVFLVGGIRSHLLFLEI